MIEKNTTYVIRGKTGDRLLTVACEDDKIVEVEVGEVKLTLADFATLVGELLEETQ